MIFNVKRISLNLPNIRQAIPSFSKVNYSNDANKSGLAANEAKLKEQFHRDLHEVMLRDPEIGTPNCRIITHKSKAMKIKRALRNVSNSNVRKGSRQRDVA